MADCCHVIYLFVCLFVFSFLFFSVPSHQSALPYKALREEGDDSWEGAACALGSLSSWSQGSLYLSKPAWVKWRCFPCPHPSWLSATGKSILPASSSGLCLASPPYLMFHGWSVGLMVSDLSFPQRCQMTVLSQCFIWSKRTQLQPGL